MDKKTYFQLSYDRQSMELKNVLSLFLSVIFFLSRNHRPKLLDNEYKKKRKADLLRKREEKRRKKRTLAFALLALQVRQYIYELYLVNE